MGQAYHMVHTGGYAWMLPYAHFIGNETRILYGKIQDYYARLIFYEYMFI